MQWLNPEEIKNDNKSNASDYRKSDEFDELSFLRF